MTAFTASPTRTDSFAPQLAPFSPVEPVRHETDYAPSVANAAPRILVIENDPQIRAKQQRMFSRAGYVPEFAGDAEAAWQLLCRKQFHLLILNHRMARLSEAALLAGLEVLGVTTPVIVTLALEVIGVLSPSPEPPRWFDTFLSKRNRPTRLLAVAHYIVMASAQPEAIEQPTSFGRVA